MYGDDGSVNIMAQKRRTEYAKKVMLKIDFDDELTGMEAEEQLRDRMYGEEDQFDDRPLPEWCTGEPGDPQPACNTKGKKLWANIHLFYDDSLVKMQGNTELGAEKFLQEVTQNCCLLI